MRRLVRRDDLYEDRHRGLLDDIDAVPEAIRGDDQSVMRWLLRTTTPDSGGAAYLGEIVQQAAATVASAVSYRGPPNQNAAARRDKLARAYRLYHEAMGPGPAVAEPGKGLLPATAAIAARWCRTWGAIALFF